MIANANSIRIPLANKSVHMCVTSPPYYGLRDYGLTGTEWDTVTYTPMAGLPSVTVQPWRGCLGLEPTPEMFVAHIVAVFREVWRVLRDDGTCWINFGDSYATGTKADRQASTGLLAHHTAQDISRIGTPSGLKTKDLIGIPWRLAFALQADGWYLRNDIIWHKPNPMPESVTDRCTKSHEYLFLLAKSARYFYDNEAVKEQNITQPGPLRNRAEEQYNDSFPGGHFSGGERTFYSETGRNRRTVWTISTTPYKGAHFATYPPDLVAPCILAGTSQRGVCPICGAQWERVIEKKGKSTYEKMKQDHGVTHEEMHEFAKAEGRNLKGGQEAWGQTRDENGNVPSLGSRESSTLGWRPTCDCNAERFDMEYYTAAEIAELEVDIAPVPAKVFDPFVGSGTTGQVARETGRKFIGLDLSIKYLRENALVRSEQKQTQESLEQLPMFTPQTAAANRQ